jgi:hypothetical protein
MKTKTGVIPMQWFLSPVGKMFRGKKSALEFIVNSGLYTKEDIRKLRCSGNKLLYIYSESVTVGKFAVHTYFI